MRHLFVFIPGSSFTPCASLPFNSLGSQQMTFLLLEKPLNRPCSPFRSRRHLMFLMFYTHNYLAVCVSPHLAANLPLQTPTRPLRPLLVTFPPWTGVAPLTLLLFSVWIGRKVSPNMAVLDFKCDSLPWASSYIKGTSGRSQFGFSQVTFYNSSSPPMRSSSPTLLTLASLSSLPRLQQKAALLKSIHKTN